MVLALLAAPTAAHDFWIEPATFRPAAGETVPLRLFVGQDFKGDAVLYAAEQFERYVYVGPGGERRVPGALGDDPAGQVPVTEPGLYVVGYYSKKFDVKFDSAAEFEKYLATEGLERHGAVANKRASLRSGVLEIYQRCAKTLLRAGNPSYAPADRALGFPLELIAQSNPYNRVPQVELQLLYHGKPLADALVVAFNKQEPLAKIKAHTDKDGRVTLALARRGTWLVTSVHMIPTSLLSRADWESFWASLTFERP